MKGQQLLLSKTFLGKKKKPQGQKFTSERSFLARDSRVSTHRDYHIMRRISAKRRNNATPV